MQPLCPFRLQPPAGTTCTCTCRHLEVIGLSVNQLELVLNGSFVALL